MKKINTTTLIIGGAIILIGGLAYVLLRKPKSKGTEPVDNTKPESSPMAFELVGLVQKANVPTVSVLTGPYGMASKVKDLESFVTVYARPSSTKGWVEISEDNQTVLGYLPQDALRKI